MGPIAGATDITITMLPDARPRRSGDTRVITVVINSGIIMAVPAACTILPTSRMSNPGASAHTNVPAVNRIIALRKTGRVLKRWMRNPVTGITTAIVSM